jgi:hypothetical protein
MPFKDTIVFSPKQRLDSDSDVRAMEKGSAIDAMNCRWGLKNDGSVFAVENVKGNELLPIILPAGSNRIIGGCQDYQNNRVIVFVYNDQNLHSILKVDMIRKEVSPIVYKDPVLNFDGTFINNPRVVNGLLVWTDNNGLCNLIIEKAEKMTFKLYREGISVWAISDDFVVQK